MSNPIASTKASLQPHRHPSSPRTKRNDNTNKCTTELPAAGLPRSPPPTSPPTSSDTKPIFAVARFSYPFFVDHLHDPYPTLQEKEAIVEEANHPQVTVASVSNWFSNARRRSGWLDICNQYCNGDTNAMVGLCTRVLRSSSPPLSHPPTPSSIDEIQEMKKLVENWHDGEIQPSDWATSLCELLESFTLEEKERMEVAYTQLIKERKNPSNRSESEPPFLSSLLDDAVPGPTSVSGAKRKVMPDQTHECSEQETHRHASASSRSSSPSMSLRCSTPSLIWSDSEDERSYKRHRSESFSSTDSVDIDWLLELRLLLHNLQTTQGQRHRSESFSSTTDSVDIDSLLEQRLPLQTTQGQTISLTDYPFTFSLNITPPSPESPSFHDSSSLPDSADVHIPLSQKRPRTHPGEVDENDAEQPQNKRHCGSRDHLVVTTSDVDWEADFLSDFLVMPTQAQDLNHQDHDAASGLQTLWSSLHQENICAGAPTFVDKPSHEGLFVTPDRTNLPDIEFYDWTKNLDSIGDADFDGIAKLLELPPSQQPYTPCDRGSLESDLAHDVTQASCASFALPLPFVSDEGDNFLNGTPGLPSTIPQVKVPLEGTQNDPCLTPLPQSDIFSWLNPDAFEQIENLPSTVTGTQCEATCEDVVPLAAPTVTVDLLAQSSEEVGGNLFHGEENGVEEGSRGSGAGTPARLI
ncbi:hypothetical protein JB92DRAFT_1114464 [Gautieria morchelliformis]|nr:hypothetical protein JB92DRAFT_1114464 [Gautieria morchelliformis]